MSTPLWAHCTCHSQLRSSHLFWQLLSFRKMHFSFSSCRSGAEAAGLWHGSSLRGVPLQPGSASTQGVPASAGSASRIPWQTCSPVISSPSDLGFWKPVSFMLITTFPFWALKNYSRNLKSIEFSSCGKCRGFAWELGTCSAQMLLYFPLSTYLHL